MDCDTTGIEPDFALVKFKKLAGGGYFKIINRAVPEALNRALSTMPVALDHENCPGELAERAAQALDAENVPRSDQTTQYQLDCRFRGQGFVLTTEVGIDEFGKGGLDLVGSRFAELHTQMFTFAPIFGDHNGGDRGDTQRTGRARRPGTRRGERISFRSDDSISVGLPVPRSVIRTYHGSWD